MKFTHAVSRELKYYVYIYSHPITDEIFYVGKGKGNRVFDHLVDIKDSNKVKMIQEIKNQGLEPKIEILVHGIEDEKTALRLESSIIDLLGIQNLTNIQSGYKSALYGRMTLEQVRSAYDRQKTEIEEPAILIRINKAFRYSMSEIELYDFTRGHWVLNPERARHAKYGFAIYEGIIQEVYEIVDWFESGKTYSLRQGNENLSATDREILSGRYEFIGNLAPASIREKYKYKSVEHYFKRGNSNPIMYKNM